MCSAFPPMTDYNQRITLNSCPFITFSCYSDCSDSVQYSSPAFLSSGPQNLSTTSASPSQRDSSAVESSPPMEPTQCVHHPGSIESPPQLMPRSMSSNMPDLVPQHLGSLTGSSTRDSPLGSDMGFRERGGRKGTLETNGHPRLDSPVQVSSRQKGLSYNTKDSRNHGTAAREISHGDDEDEEEEECESETSEGDDKDYSKKVIKEKPKHTGKITKIYCSFFVHKFMANNTL